MTFHCNVPDDLRGYLRSVEVGLYLLSQQQRPRGKVQRDKGKTARVRLSPRGQQLFEVARHDFETRREVVLTALALVKERPHLQACNIACL